MLLDGFFGTIQGDQRQTEIVMEFAAAGIDGDRAAKERFGIGCPAALPEEDAQAVQGGGVIGTERRTSW